MPTTATDLLKRHIDTLVDDAAQWQTLIADDPRTRYDNKLLVANRAALDRLVADGLREAHPAGHATTAHRVRRAAGSARSGRVGRIHGPARVTGDGGCSRARQRLPRQGPFQRWRAGEERRCSVHH